MTASAAHNLPNHNLDERTWVNVPAVEVRDLHKTYANGIEAVRGIDFEIEPGEVFGLLGPNGAGKSTTIGMLTTSILPSRGSARVVGYDVRTEPLMARSASSVIFQEASVDRGLTGRANLELHARLWRISPSLAQATISGLSDELGLTELLNRPVAGYSGGERRRLEIARALVSRPQVLFMDEPTVGLDPRIRHELLDVLAGIRSGRQLTILITTHDLAEAQRLCDRVAIVQHGRIIALETLRALLARLGSEILEFRVDGEPERALTTLRDRGVGQGRAFAVGARVTVPLAGEETTEAIAALDGIGLQASHIATRTPTLDDAYLFFTGKHRDTED
jgi:ABC-2 type transport system ATP-binding protein